MTSKAWAWLNITSEEESEMTENTLQKTTDKSTVVLRNGRRRLLGTTLAMATGVGLQSLLADQAIADQHAGHVITPIRSPEKVMGPMQEVIQHVLIAIACACAWR